MTVIVGMSCSHDASACLMVDGVLWHAIQIERLTGKKHDGRPFLNTRLAVDYCLNAAGLAPDDVDLFAFNSQNLLPGQVGLGFPLCDRSFDLFDPVGPRSLFVSHHLAHAFGAFFCSPFDASAVLVIDGSGGSVVGAEDLILTGPELADYIRRPVPTPRPAYHAESLYHFDGAGFVLLDRYEARSFHPVCGASSLGETFASVSQYIFGDWQDGGKLMGLAPYGKAEAFGPSLLAVDAEGRLQFTQSWKEPLDHAETYSPPLAHANLAARVQADLESAVLDRTSRAVAKSGQTALAYAGGVALNSAANQRILEESPVEALYVMPASHDAGISIGAAAAAWFHLTDRTRGTPVRNDYLGRAYSPAEVKAAQDPWVDWLEATQAGAGELAEALHSGLICARFAGGSEFGPRALGHRSILAAPFERAMWDRLNSQVKYREEFRPYAPLVLAEEADRYFEMGPDPSSPYMLRIVRVRPEMRGRLAAVTHVNGTARVQTVHRDQSPFLHALLTAFADRSGDPVLINTSLNVRGRPIVETPSQAIEMLLSTGVETLHLEGKLLRPHTLSADALPEARVRLAPATRLTAESRGAGLACHITSDAQDRKAHPVSRELFDLLSAPETDAPLRDRLAAAPPCRHAALLIDIQDLLRRNLLLCSPRGEN